MPRASGAGTDLIGRIGIDPEAEERFKRILAQNIRRPWTDTKRKEDALYMAVFVGTELDCTQEGKAAARQLRREFPQLGDQVIDQLQRHEGNARCGILASALPGYSREQVIRMVDAGAWAGP